jgi:chemotaxis protein methyltransferase CheR
MDRRTSALPAAALPVAEVWSDAEVSSIPGPDAGAFDVRPFEPIDVARTEWTPVETDTLSSSRDVGGERDPRDSYESAYAQGDYDAAATLARNAIADGEDSEAVWTILVRSLANRGRLEAAGEACASALDRHRLSATLTHLHAILLAEAGRHAEAGEAARRALYLEPQYIVAHLALGDARARIGDVAGARRAFRNAESLLLASPPQALIEGGDGSDAATLLGIARFRLSALGPVPEARR